MGMAYLEPAKDGNWRFMFLPWTAVRSVKKAVKLGSSLDQVSGDVMFKKGRRGAFGRIYFKLMRQGNETRSDLKQRKKEIRQILPDLYKSAKKTELDTEPVELVFRGASGIGNPINVMGPTSAGVQQSPDADVFPGFSQGSTAGSSQSFNFGSSTSSQDTESFEEEWDDSWFEEQPTSSAQTQPTKPQTDFLPSQKPSIDDSDSEDWNWDDWED